MGRKNKNRNKGTQPDTTTELKVHDPPKEDVKPDSNTMRSLASLDKTAKQRTLPPPKEPESPVAEDKKNSQATVQNHDPGKTESNVKSRQAAEEAIEFMCTDMKEHLTTTFWETIRDTAISKVGIPLAPTIGITPMNEKQAKAFEREKMPYGRYVDKTVLHVRKKDAEYLKNFSNQPDSFQKQIRRYHAFLRGVKPVEQK